MEVLGRIKPSTYQEAKSIVASKVGTFYELMNFAPLSLLFAVRFRISCAKGRFSLSIDWKR
jgi:hypothetical protein